MTERDNRDRGQDDEVPMPESMREAASEAGEMVAPAARWSNEWLRQRGLDRRRPRR